MKCMSLSTIIDVLNKNTGPAVQKKTTKSVFYCSSKAVGTPLCTFIHVLNRTVEVGPEPEMLALLGEIEYYLDECILNVNEGGKSYTWGNHEQKPHKHFYVLKAQI